MAKILSALLHWNDKMKGTALKASGSSTLRTFSSRFIDHLGLLSPSTVAASTSFNERLAYTDQA